MSEWINQFFLILLISLSLCVGVIRFPITHNPQQVESRLPPPTQRSDWVVASVSLARTPPGGMNAFAICATDGMFGPRKKRRPGGPRLNRIMPDGVIGSDLFSSERLSEAQKKRTQIKGLTGEMYSLPAPIKNFALISRCSLLRTSSPEILFVLATIFPRPNSNFYSPAKAWLSPVVAQLEAQIYHLF